MPKCNFNKVAIEIALRHRCSPVNLLHIFRTPFPRKTSGRLLLLLPKSSRPVVFCKKGVFENLFQIYIQENTCDNVVFSVMLQVTTLRKNSITGVFQCFFKTAFLKHFQTITSFSRGIKWEHWP